MLTGGNTKFAGFENRFFQELQALAPEGTWIETETTEASELDTWKGVAAYAMQESFYNSYISREEYNEVGASIIDRKYI